MKALFCTDVTLDKNNREKIGKEFVVKEVSAISKSRIQESKDKIKEIREKSSPSNSLLLVAFPSFFIGLFLLLITLSKYEEVTLQDAFNESPISFTIGGSLLAFSIILLLFGMFKKPKGYSTKNLLEHLEILKEDIKSNHIELRVPFDSKSVDILVFFYKEINGIPKVTYAPYQEIYSNVPHEIFATPGYINIADHECVYSFQLSELKRIKTINKMIPISGWYKEEHHRSEKYMNYKIGRDKHHNYHISQYHVLEIERYGETYGIYFPCYELPIFEELTGLIAEKSSFSLFS